MNKEKILENVGEIDPRFIREAAPSPRRRMLRIAAAAAAVVLLAVGLALVLPKLVKPEKELSSAVPSSTEPPKETSADLPGTMPDPIVPGMKAQMPWMIPQEWYRERGELGFRLFDESSLRFSGVVGSEQELFSVVDALSSNWSINVDGSLAGVSENAPRIVLFSGDDELVIWQGSNFVKYSGSGAIRWFRADDYVGSKFGTGYIFDELMNGPLLREYAAASETAFYVDAFDDTLLYMDGSWHMLFDETGEYIPLIDRSEELLRLYSETEQTEADRECLARFLAHRASMTQSREEPPAPGRVG